MVPRLPDLRLRGRAHVAHARTRLHLHCVRLALHEHVVRVAAWGVEHARHDVEALSVMERGIVLYAAAEELGSVLRETLEEDTDG